MIENFDHLVKKIGHITNGNRVYYNRRSQPPLFPHMVQVKYVTKMIKFIQEENDQNCWFINGFWFRITWHPMKTSSTSESCWLRWFSKADHYITIVVMITTLIIIATIAIITGNQRWSRLWTRNTNGGKREWLRWRWPETNTNWQGGRHNYMIIWLSQW